MVREDRHSSSSELTAWLALLRVPRLGPGRIRSLLDRYATPSGIFAASVDDLRNEHLPGELIDGLRRPDWRAAEADRNWLADNGCHFISCRDPHYPELLREIPDPPPGLFVRGDIQLLSSLQIAIVGSRNPSPAGRRTARELAVQLAGAGITVVSGMALGIDSRAHEGALEAGMATVAVLGNGLKTVYPARNRDLAGRIVEYGALVSEFPPEVKPLAANFPRRNRIISGLSVGVVVVEAATRSGSLITARCAMEQGREVFAVPGSIYNPLARGCHALIKQGVKLTETVEDILEEIGALSVSVYNNRHPADFQAYNGAGLDEASKLLLDNIGDAPVTIDQLSDLTLMSVDEISAKLLELELQGLIESIAGGAYIRRE